jgi:hypothetical protein
VDFFDAIVSDFARLEVETNSEDSKQVFFCPREF